jgi:magnesium chelatase family protein
MSQAVDRLGLSARAYHRTLKVARTIADLRQEKILTSKHLLEALNLRTSVLFK